MYVPAQFPSYLTDEHPFPVTLLYSTSPSHFSPGLALRSISSSSYRFAYDTRDLYHCEGPPRTLRLHGKLAWAPSNLPDLSCRSSRLGLDFGARRHLPCLPEQPGGRKTLGDYQSSSASVILSTSPPPNRSAAKPWKGLKAFEKSRGTPAHLSSLTSNRNAIPRDRQSGGYGYVLMVRLRLPWTHF